MAVQFSSVGDVSTRTLEKETFIPQETCLWMPRCLRWRRGLMVACCGVGGMGCSSTCMGSFEGSHHYLHSIQFCSVAQSCLTLCNPMDCSTPDLPVHHQLPEFIQTLVHWVSDAIHPFINSTKVWPQVNSREGTQLHPSTENWIKDLLNMALPIRKRPSIPHSQSIPSGSFHKLLILLHQRANRLKTTEWLYHFNILRGNIWEI